MYYSITLISIFEVLLEIVPMLLVIAFITVAERKTMASMQRRLGPNAVGYYNLSLKRSYLDNHGVFMINKNILINSFAKVGTTNRKLFGSLSSAASTTQPFSCNPD